MSSSRIRSRKDHPRSRGVYGNGAVIAGRLDGSSPLARGLLRFCGRLPDGSGIIPARAGFTNDFKSKVITAQDHPRSRGVYPITRMAPSGIVGSSPLARGLPAYNIAGNNIARIIPARAGFTIVYRSAMTRTPGSSPLARGLRCAHSRHEHYRRIIPARAGFTARSETISSRSTDHPRSRGVYLHPASQDVGRLGSSPLARGLPPRPPAGARGGGDHPRSRGVYLPALLREHGEEGIIPARAGFTRRSSGPPRTTRDHPRSRGVYLNQSMTSWTAVGSSPLARGLRGVGAAQAPAGRIIPARAGFTSVIMSRAATLKDHPRSRGVYTVDHTLARNISGSSPLARGLRALARGYADPARIIPARAGFTSRQPTA